VAAVTCARCGAALAIDARFCSTCGAPVAVTLDERRIVTVLFADLSGFTSLAERLDPEQVKRIIDRAFARLSLVVERYGGRIDTVIGDELLAVFGAPESHEDDPERAVRCAFAMRVELEQMRNDPTMPPLTMHIGVNTGEVVAGMVGGRDYTILGDAVNIGRRIQEAAAPGQILVVRFLN
jgi:class 3 adenylate cyclase